MENDSARWHNKKRGIFVPEVAKHRAGDRLAIDLLHPTHHLSKERREKIHRESSLTIRDVHADAGNAEWCGYMGRSQILTHGHPYSPCTCDLLGRQRQLPLVRLPPTLHSQSPWSAALAPERGSSSHFSGLQNLESPAEHLNNPCQLGEAKHLEKKSLFFDTNRKRGKIVNGSPCREEDTRWIHGQWWGPSGAHTDWITHDVISRCNHSKDSPEHLNILHHNHLICWLGKNCIL